MELIWNDTPQEHLELNAAAQRNCTCTTDFKGARVSVCESHTMLVQHQRVLNGPLFGAAYCAALHLRGVAPERSRGHWPGSEQVIQQLSASNQARSSETRPLPKSRTRFGNVNGVVRADY